MISQLSVKTRILHCANGGATKVVEPVGHDPAATAPKTKAWGEDPLSRELATVRVRCKNCARTCQIDEEHGGAHAQDVVGKR